MAASDDTQRRLLEAAGQVFAEKGFQAATVREICQRAEANIAAVNYYFRDKEQLYKAALNNAFQCRLDQLLIPKWSPDVSPAEKLRTLIRMIVTQMGSTTKLPWQMQLLLRELSQPSEAGEELVREFIRPIYEVLWSILREVLPAGTPEERIHLIGFSIVGQCFYLRVARAVIGLVVGEQEHHRYDPERLADHICEFSLAALGLDKALAAAGVRS